MNRQEIEALYTRKGLTLEYGRDVPDKYYPSHRHEKTYLYTLSGSLRIKTAGQWHILKAGQEFIIAANQPHEATVGDEGWEYVAAWDEAEAQKYEQTNAAG